MGTFKPEFLPIKELNNDLQPRACFGMGNHSHSQGLWLSCDPLPFLKEPQVPTYLKEGCGQMGGIFPESLEDG